MSTSKKISVIIPHLNQESYLQTCLVSLHKQVGLRRTVEIIVVDNGSLSLPIGICEKWSDVRLLEEPTPGPGIARNTGVANSTGELLAFIDADCVADQNWLAQVEAGLDGASDKVIGGDVRVSYATPGRPTFLEPYESIYSYRNDKHIAEGYSGSGNLAVTREVFERVGPFAGIEVAEDYDWGLRATQLGFPPKYNRNMIIYHPARPSFSELARKWDRHIAHEFVRKTGSLGWIKWVVKALALPFSSLVEIPTIMTSRRVSGHKERLLAFACLVRVRIYRANRMLQFMFSNELRQAAGGWNRNKKSS